MPTLNNKRRGAKARRLVQPSTRYFQKPSDNAAQTLRRFYDSASVMMGTVELSADDIVHISDNRAAATFFETTPEAMRGRTAKAMGVPEEYVKLWLEAYRASVTSPEPVRFDYNHVGRGWLKVTVNYIGMSGGRQRFLYVVDDISDLKASESALQEAHDRLDDQVKGRTAELEAANHRLQHDAYYDTLTGLPNRLLFNDRLTHALERYQRELDSLAVLFMDLDHFKVINDSLGHPAGDALLVAVGERLSACVREADTVARFGGDEFAVLLEHCDAVRAAEVATRMQAALTQPFRIKERVFTLSASVGLLIPESGHARAQDVLRDADLAMYHAKAHRSGRYEIFDPTMREGAVRRLELEADLRVALREGALSLHFQPIIRLGDGYLTGFEALVRWYHRKHGLLAPDAFIPLAEETGLIIELDRYVLREACSQLARWRAEFPERTELSINVNLSSQQFMHEGLVQEVEGALLKNGLSPRNLNLEITESLLMRPIASVDTVVEQLIALGVGLCLDDFGTGYSSLSYLRRFPARTLKIDRGFVQDMDLDEKGANLVEAVVMMAQKLGMRGVAEGVETGVQLARLRELGCEYGQGYLFAKPLPVEQAGALLNEPSSIRDGGV